MAATERRQGARQRWGSRGRRRGRRWEPEARGAWQHTPPARRPPYAREAKSAGNAPDEGERQTAPGTCQYTPLARIQTRRQEAQ